MSHKTTPNNLIAPFAQTLIESPFVLPVFFIISVIAYASLPLTFLDFYTSFLGAQKLPINYAFPFWQPLLYAILPQITQLTALFIYFISPQPSDRQPELYLIKTISIFAYLVGWFFDAWADYVHSFSGVLPTIQTVLDVPPSLLLAPILPVLLHTFGSEICVVIGWGLRILLHKDAKRVWTKYQDDGYEMGILSWIIGLAFGLETWVFGVRIRNWLVGHKSKPKSKSKPTPRRHPSAMTVEEDEAEALSDVAPRRERPLRGASNRPN